MAAASSGKQRQAAASSGKQRQAAASSGKQRHILHGCLPMEAAVKNALGLARQGLTQGLLLARLLGSGLDPAIVQPALAILCMGMLPTAAYAQSDQAETQLEALQLSEGTKLRLPPANLFEADTLTYDDTVTEDVRSLTVTPTVKTSGATVTVNGRPVVSGMASDPIALDYRANAIIIVVTSADGMDSRTYRVNMLRTGGADLSALTISQGTLSPAFAPDERSYTVTVANSVSGLYVTPTVATAGATISIDGAAVASGTQSSRQALRKGTNTINIAVTPPGLASSSTNTSFYMLTVYRVGDAELSALTLSTGTLEGTENPTFTPVSTGILNPDFAPGTLNYFANVVGSVTGLTVTPIVNAGATVTVDGKTVTSGSASGAIDLRAGNATRNVSIVVTAGSTTKTYTVAVNRHSGGNWNPIQGLRLQMVGGPFSSPRDAILNVPIQPNRVTYRVSDPVPLGASLEMRLIPIGQADQNKFTINGRKVRTYQYTPVPLQPGENNVVIQSVSRSGAIGIVTVTIDKQHPAALTDLVPSAGTLRPAFNPTFERYYRVTLPPDVGAFTVTPQSDDSELRTDAGGTRTSVAEPVGTPSRPILLDPGQAKTAWVWVYREDQTGIRRYIKDRLYEVRVVRPGVGDEADASLSALVLDEVEEAADLSLTSLRTLTLSPGFAADTTSYALSVPPDFKKLRVLPTANNAALNDDDETFRMVLNGKDVRQAEIKGALTLRTGVNEILLSVRADDEVTWRTYRIVVTKRAPATLKALALAWASPGTNQRPTDLSDSDFTAIDPMPVFASGTASYTVSVPSTATLLRLTPTRPDKVDQDDADARVTVNDVALGTSEASFVSLVPGGNRIALSVMAADGISRMDYSLLVTRALPPSGQLSLSFANQPRILVQAGAAMASVTLPAATGGTAPYSYTLVTGAPTWLSLDASTRALTGTAPAGMGSDRVSVQVTDSASATATASFNLVRAALAFGAVPPLDRVYPVDQAITDLVLPAATGGTGAVTYTLTPPLPAGITFTASTRTLGGTPSAATATTVYTYLATDSALPTANTAQLRFSLTVEANQAPSFGAASVPNQLLVKDELAPSLRLPVAAGGNAPLIYALTPALPAGLAFNAAMGIISGTPTAVTSPTEYTLTVTDADGQTATLTFRLEVLAQADSAPLLPTDSVLTDRILMENVQIATITLPAATGGNGTLTYTLTPDLPTGLTFNAATRTISGTPTVASSRQIYTYRASDGDSNTAASDGDQRRFTLAVLSAPTMNAPGITYPAAPTRLQVGTAMRGLLPVVGGFSGTPTYTLTGTLPKGLSLNAATGIISGTPTEAKAGVSTVTVTAMAGSESPRSTQVTLPAVGAKPTGVTGLTLTPDGPGELTVSWTAATVAPDGYWVRWRQQEPRGSFIGRIETTETSYTIGGLQAGIRYLVRIDTLALNKRRSAGTAKTATGTPSSSATPILFYVDSTALPGRLPTRLVVGETIDSLTPGVRHFANGAVIAYSVTSGTLPSGISLDAATGVISGTPTTPSDTGATVTIRATAGAQTADRMLTFPAVERGLRYPTPRPLFAGIGITPLAPIVTGFTGELTFRAITNPLSGILLNTETGVISGAPNAVTLAPVEMIVDVTVQGTSQRAVYTLRFPRVQPIPDLRYDGLPVPLQVGAPVSLTPMLGSDFTVTRYALTDGSLPAGLSFNTSTGVISGMPTTPAQSVDEQGVSVTVTATGTKPDGGGNQAIATPTARVDFQPVRYAPPTVAAIADITSLVVGTPQRISVSPSGVPGGAPVAIGAALGSVELDDTFSVNSIAVGTVGSDSITLYGLRAGTETVTVFAIVGEGVAASREGRTTFQLTVTDATLTAEAGDPPTSAAVGTAVTLTGSARGGAPGVMNRMASYGYAWTVVSEPTGSSVSISDADKASASFTPTHNGTYQLRLTVTDSATPTANTATDTVDVVVPTSSGTNSSPDITDITDKSVTFGATLEVDVDATDADAGDTLVFKAESDDTGVATVAPTADTNLVADSKITLTPVAVGTAIITVTVSDGTASPTDTFELTVDAAKLDKPTGLALKTDSKSKNGFTVTWTAVANAADYEASAMRSDNTGTAVTGTVDTSGTTPEAVFTGLAENIAYTVTVTATGSGNYANSDASDGFEVTTAANSAPTVANPIPDQAATTGTAFSFTLPAGTFSDADNDSLTYTAMQTDGTTDSALPSWLSFTAGTGVFSGTPASTDTGTLMVKVTASDGTDSVSDTFDIVVSAPVPPLVAPTGLMATPLVNGFTVSWTAVPGAETYEAYVVRTDLTTTARISATKVSGTSADWVSLNPAATYRVSVIAKADGLANSAVGTLENVMPGVPPAGEAIKALYFSSIPGDLTGTYQLGEQIQITIKFKSPVALDSMVGKRPSIGLQVGDKLKQVSLIDVGDADTLVATYFVKSGDRDTDGVSIAANAISLNGGKITSASDSTMNMTLTHAALPTDPRRKVDSSINTNPNAPSAPTLTGSTYGSLDVPFDVVVTATDADGDGLLYYAGRPVANAEVLDLAPTSSNKSELVSGTSVVTVTPRRAGRSATFRVFVEDDGVPRKSNSTAFEVFVAGLSYPAAAALQLNTAITDLMPTTTNFETGSTITYAVTDGTSLPAGLNLASGTGIISGTPTAEATAPVTVTATGTKTDGGVTRTQTAKVTVAFQGTPRTAVTNLSLTASVRGEVTATWTAASYAPSGYKLRWRKTGAGGYASGDEQTLVESDTTATITGLDDATEYRVRIDTLAADGTFLVSDTGVSKDITTSDGPSLSYPALPTMLRAGVQFATLTPTLAGFKSDSTYSYEVTTGNLPSGLALNTSSGAISGTPDTPTPTDGSSGASVTVTVTGTTGTGMSEQTETATVTLDFPRIFRFRLSAPTVTLAVGDTQLTANWEAVPNAATYALQWKESSVTSWTAATGVTTVDPATPGTVITGLTNGTTYDVRVRSKAASDSATHVDGDWSSAVQAAPVANSVPSITDITNKTATFGTNLMVDVDATDADTGDTLQYQATSSDATVATVTPTALTNLVDASQVTVTPVAAGTATITVTVSDGTASPTDTFVVTVSRAQLGTPVVAVLAQDGKLTVTWVGITNAASYEVEYKESTSDTWLNNDDDTSPAEIDSLTNGTEYDVRVRAKAASASTTYADSAWSDVAKGTPVETDVAPSFGSETVAAQTWTVGMGVDVTLPTATGGNGTISYELTPALPSGVTLNSSTRKITGAPTAVASAATYTWRAKDSDSNTADSDTAALTFSVTVGKGTLATPTGLTLKANTQRKTSFTVTWTAVPNATGYTATATPSGGTAVNGVVDTTGTNPEAAFTGLTAGTTYEVSVVATGDTANYEASTAATLNQATAANAAPSITDITNKAATFGTNLMVDVDATDTNPEDTLQYQASSGDAAVATVTPTSLTDLGTNSQITVTPVAAGTATITVMVSDGTASPTDIFVVTVSRAQLGTPVVTVSAQDGELTVTWPDVPNAASYEVEYKEGTSDTWLNNDDDTSPAEIDSLTNGTEYDVRVRAKAAAGSTTYADSAWSEVKKGTPVVEDVAPSFGSETIAAQTWTVGTAVDVTLPVATGGNGTISYELTPALPSGVTLNSSTRVASGAPTAVASAATYTWRAKDSDSNTANTDTAALTFSVTVNKATLAAPTGLDVKANSKTRTGFTITWTAVANATGYKATARTSGQPDKTVTLLTAPTNPEAVFTGLAMETTYTVTVIATGNANYDNSPVSNGQSVATLANSAPTVANAIADQTATVGVAFSFTLPAGTFSDADSGDSLTYMAMQTDGTTDSALPTWLSFTAGTGVFSGTPTSTDTGTLSVKVTASDGTASVSDTFNIVVNVPPALTFSKDSLTVGEGGSGTYTVALAVQPRENVTVAVTVSGSSDVTVSPASLTFTSTTWNTAQTVTVTAAPDDDAGDDTATVNQAASGGGYNSVTGSVAVTVDDDDTPALEFVPTSVVVNEGAGSNYTVALATQPSATVTVTVGGWSDTDVSVDTDPDPGNQTTLTFTTTNWSMAQTVMVSATEDADTVDDRVTLSHTVTGGDYGSVTGNLEVRVDDNDSPGLVFTPTALTVDEGGSDTYTVALATPPAGNVTVTVGTTSNDVTVDTDTDTAGAQDTLTFSNSNWDTPQTVTVSAANDADTTDDSVTLTHRTTGYNSVSDNLTVTVDDDDQSLTYSAAPTTLMVGTPITALTATATGFGSRTVAYLVTTGTLPAGLTINAITGAITGTPTMANRSMTTVTVTATAGTGTDTQTATADIPFPAVDKGTLATPTGLALKPDTRSKTGFTVTWTAVENATGYTATAVQGSNSFMGAVNVTEATFTGLAVNTTYTVSVVAKDNTANYNDSPAGTLRLSTAANQAPTVANMIPDQSATVDTVFSFTVPANTFSDADGDTLTYRATKADDMALPAWLTFNPDARTFSGTPTSTDIGTLMVKVTASDGMGGSISDTFNIMVSTTTANQAPTVVNMIPDQSATVDMVFSFTVPANTFSDADGDTLTYRATKADDMALPAWLTFNPDARTFSGTPTSTDTGTLMVKVTASDGMGGSISDTFNIMVSTTTANQEMKEKLEGVNEEITPSIVNEVVGRQMASITDRFATISSGFHMGSLSMEEVVTDVADYLFSHHQDIQANGFDWRQALSGHNFSFALADTSVSQDSMDDGEPSSSGSGPVSFWGGIDYSSLEDRIEPFSLDGDITSFNFGVDKEFTSDLIAGVLLSIANSEFELAEDSTDSTYEVDIFTVNPYISWEASDELSLWASVGYGRGHTDLTDDSTNDTFSQGDNFTRFSAGGRFQLWQSETGTALALKLDGATAHFLGADVQRSRLATELSHDFSIESGVLNTALELGLLMSSADESAAELVGGLHWQGDAGLSSSIRSRVLLGGGNRQEWGIGGALRYTTATEGEREGEGLVVSLEPSFGISNPKLLSELWSATRLDLAVTREAPTAQLNVKLAYGFPTSDGLLTPYTDFSFSETTNTYVTGLRYGLPTGWNLNLKGMRKTSTTDAAENTILLELHSDL